MYERLISIGTYHLFIFNHTSTTEIYTLSLHDALPIWLGHVTAAPLVELGNAPVAGFDLRAKPVLAQRATSPCTPVARSEEHTSELQSRRDLVCRLLLEKKKQIRRCGCRQRDPPRSSHC